MRILALDTSSKYLCLGVYDGENSFEYKVDFGVSLSRVLAPVIDRVLESAGLAISGIDIYAAGSGPGSFTALRIGHACVKALAWANGKPVAGIPTLDIIACHPGLGDGTIIPVVDAKRSLFYCGFYSKSGGAVKKRCGERLLSAEELISSIKKHSDKDGKSAIITGDGLGPLGDVIKRCLPSAARADKEFWYPGPRALLALARAAASGKKVCDAFRLEPIYLYPQECQVKARRNGRLSKGRR